MPRISGLAIYGTLIAFGFLALGGVLLIQPGAESTQRLGLYFGLISPIVLALIALVRSDQAQQNTNGKLDARIQAAVHRANDARRRGDEPLTDAEIRNAPADTFS